MDENQTKDNLTASSQMYTPEDVRAMFPEQYNAIEEEYRRIAEEQKEQAIEEARHR